VNLNSKADERSIGNKLLFRFLSHVAANINYILRLSLPTEQVV
jgi:hypothetical protein